MQIDVLSGLAPVTKPVSAVSRYINIRNELPFSLSHMTGIPCPNCNLCVETSESYLWRKYILKKAILKDKLTWLPSTRVVIKVWECSACSPLLGLRRRSGDGGVSYRTGGSKLLSNVVGYQVLCRSLSYNLKYLWALFPRDPKNCTLHPVLLGQRYLAWERSPTQFYVLTVVVFFLMLLGRELKLLNMCEHTGNMYPNNYTCPFSRIKAELVWKKSFSGYSHT